MTVVLGLTGGIASGKTTASNFFIGEGIPVVDADLIARAVVEVGTPGLGLIVEQFGEEILNPDGSLNRKKLGGIIFAAESLRQKLNQILSAEISAGISEGIRYFAERGAALVVVDIPLLFEGGYDQTVDLTMVIDVPEDIQLARLMARDNLTKEQALERINSQWPLAEKKKLADVVIDNQGTEAELIVKLSRWLKKQDF